MFVGSIALLVGSQTLLWLSGTGVYALSAALLVFFIGFMVLEAQLPAFVSRAAPAGARGAAIAVYSTVQFLGAFCGGALGGLLLQHIDRRALFIANVIMLLLWFVAALNMRIIDNARERESSTSAARAGSSDLKSSAGDGSGHR